MPPRPLGGESGRQKASVDWGLRRGQAKLGGWRGREQAATAGIEMRDRWKDERGGRWQRKGKVGNALSHSHRDTPSLCNLLFQCGSWKG